MAQRKHSAVSMERFGRRLRAGVCLCSAAAAVFVASGCGRTALEDVDEARLARGSPEKERLLTRALEKDPTLREARYARALVRAHEGKYAEALADYDVIRENTRSAEGLAHLSHLRGQVLERLGRFADAIDSYTTALDYDPGVLTPLIARARAQFVSGRYDRAMLDYDAMLNWALGHDGARGRGDWRLERGITAFCAGEWTVAADDLAAAAGGLPSSEARETAFLNLYFVMCRQGRREEADEFFAPHAAKTFPRDGDRQEPAEWTLVAVWYAAGLIDEERLLKASEDKRKDVAARQTARAYYYIGARSLADGDRSHALEAFKKCLEHDDPGLFEHHMADVETDRLICGGKAAGDYMVPAMRAATSKEKIELYTQALQVDPGCAAARLERALLYVRTGRERPAIDDFARLLEIYERPADVAAALSYRAEARARLGEHDAAVGDYRRAVETAPDQWRARSGLADGLCVLRKYEEAAAVYAELTEEVGTGPFMLRWEAGRAFALSCAGEWEAAASGFRSALERAGGLSLLRVNLFIAECKLGDAVEAATRLKTYAVTRKEAGWQNFVTWYVVGMLDEAKLLGLSEHSEPDAQVRRASAAHYYIGAVRLLRGEKPAARAAFERCVELGRGAWPESWEYRMALAELARPEQWR